MALAITAPAIVTHSGEVDPALYPQGNEGAAFADIVGTTDTSGGNVDVTITQPEMGCQVKVTVTATVFAFTTAGKLQFIPLNPGLYTVSCKDVTSGNTVTQQIEVFGIS